MCPGTAGRTDWRTAVDCTINYVLYCTVLYCTVLYFRYGLEGWIADLPQLHVGRFSHGCGGYVSDGDLVSTGEQE